MPAGLPQGTHTHMHTGKVYGSEEDPSRFQSKRTALVWLLARIRPPETHNQQA